MVTWNQSSRCSESGLRYSGRSRTSSPPSVRKVTADDRRSRGGGSARRPGPAGGVRRHGPVLRPCGDRSENGPRHARRNDQLHHRDRGREGPTGMPIATATRAPARAGVRRPGQMQQRGRCVATSCRREIQLRPTSAARSRSGARRRYSESAIPGGAQPDDRHQRLAPRPPEPASAIAGSPSPGAPSQNAETSKELLVRQVHQDWRPVGCQQRSRCRSQIVQHFSGYRHRCSTRLCGSGGTSSWPVMPRSGTEMRCHRRVRMGMVPPPAANARRPGVSGHHSPVLPAPGGCDFQHPRCPQAHHPGRRCQLWRDGRSGMMPGLVRRGRRGLFRGCERAVVQGVPVPPESGTNRGRQAGL